MQKLKFSIEQFKKELEVLINKYSIENICDTPDFLLAEIIIDIIVTTGPKIKKLLDWHGCNSVCHPLGRKDTKKENDPNL